MFDQFEDDAKRAFNEARKEALRLRHDYLDAEHIVLGLLLVPDSTAVRMLQTLTDVASIRSRIETLIGARKERDLAPNQLPFTNRSKKVLQRSMEEAGRLGDKYIGTEHLLIACALEVNRENVELLGCSAQQLRSALGRVPRGEHAPSNRGQRLPPDTEDARADGSTLQKLLYAAKACDQVKEELIHDERFEQASRARDIAHWLRKLAEDLGGKASSG